MNRANLSGFGLSGQKKEQCNSDNDKSANHFAYWSLIQQSVDWLIALVFSKALLVQKDDAGSKGHQHHGDACRYTKSGHKRRRTVSALAHDNVTEHRDKKLQHTTVEQPVDRPVRSLEDLLPVQILDDAPNCPKHEWQWAQ